MPLTTIRARPETRDRINALASARNLSVPDLLDELTQEADDDAMIAATNARFAQMHETGEFADYKSELDGWGRRAAETA